MNALCISGGATKIVGEFGVAEQIFQKFRPEYIAGVSAGAVLALALPTINWENECNCRSSKLMNTLLRMKSKDLWTVNPTNSKGGLSVKAVIRAITGFSSFGDMSSSVDNTIGY
jgi:predicted acylesterase/phospholipase RssA